MRRRYPGEPQHRNNQVKSTSLPVSDPQQRQADVAADIIANPFKSCPALVLPAELRPSQLPRHFATSLRYLRRCHMPKTRTIAFLVAAAISLVDHNLILVVSFIAADPQRMQ